MYRSISCELLADAAVLPGLPNEPFSRFTPKAAQSRFDRTWAGSSVALILRVVVRSLRAARTDLPPSISGLGSVIGFQVLGGLGGVLGESGGGAGQYRQGRQGLHKRSAIHVIVLWLVFCKRLMPFPSGDKSVWPDQFKAVEGSTIPVARGPATDEKQTVAVHPLLLRVE